MSSSGSLHVEAAGASTNGYFDTSQREVPGTAASDNSSYKIPFSLRKLCGFKGDWPHSSINDENQVSYTSPFIIAVAAPKGQRQRLVERTPSCYLVHQMANRKEERTIDVNGQLDCFPGYRRQ